MNTHSLLPHHPNSYITDAGFVHLDCLAEYAAAKRMQANNDMIDFIKPWYSCPSCHQYYQNELAVYNLLDLKDKGGQMEEGVKTMITYSKVPCHL